MVKGDHKKWKTEEDLEVSVENNGRYERNPVFIATYSLKWNFKRRTGRCDDCQ